MQSSVSQRSEGVVKALCEDVLTCTAYLQNRLELGLGHWSPLRASSQ